jgi:heterotetrameric sarcosine oxidase gamma subunit
VAVRERADIGCVLLKAAVDEAQVVYPASVAVGVDLPLAPGRVQSESGRTALWLSPRAWLVHCAVEEEGELVRRVNGAFEDKLLHAVRFTDALCWLELSGSGALGLLTEGGFVSLEQAGLAIGYAKRTLVAQVAVIVLRESESVWLVAVERSRARYFMDWLRSATE